MTAPNPVQPDSVDDSELREEVRAWLAEHWRTGVEERVFIDEVVDDRWACPHWPLEWFGRGLSPSQVAVVAEEFQAVDAPGGGVLGSRLAANPIVAETLLAFASDDLKQRFLRDLLVGTFATCLLYSEPGAGSDLASLQTRAERDGDEWVVNGQKVWTTLGHKARYGVLLARTDWDVPKHKGITYFVMPMDQAGVEVRPIKQITGDIEFNEVFFTDARVPDANRVGNLHDGWRVLQTALAAERVLMGASRKRTDPTATVSATEEGGADFVALARERGVAGDLVVRQALALLYSRRKVNQWNAERSRAAMLAGSSSPLASLGKLAMSTVLHSAADINSRVLGAEAMLMGDSSAAADQINKASMTAFINSIGGGSDQIQRNIIGERVLCLPREPEVDKDVPFREVRKAEAVRRFG